MKLHHVLAVAALAGGGLAFAQSTPPSGLDTSMSSDYTTLDSDKDGKISKKEASVNKDLTAKWASLDSNKDGKLDQAEFARFEAAPSASGSTPPAPTK